MKKRNSTRIGSVCVQNVTLPSSTKPHHPSICASTSFEFSSVEEGMEIFTNQRQGYVYGRYANPTMDVAVQKVKALESHGLDINLGGVMTSSGMSAISTLLLSKLETGDKILSQANVYGGTTELMNKVIAKCGIELVLTDLKDLDGVESVIRRDSAIKMLFLETPSNPVLQCLDLAALATLANKHNVLTAVDNTFATPYLQQPFKFGVDYVIHSTTKYLNGHGTGMAGFILGTKPQEFDKGSIWETMKLAGTNSNAFDAWMVYTGMKTLKLRMDAHSHNAMKLATYLESHQKISAVHYPGLSSHSDHELAKNQMRDYGGMMSFELAGGVNEGIQFMNALKFCVLAPTLGDVDTLVLHPASMSHLKIPKAIRLANGITDGLIRISVGIEDAEDIIQDVEQALDRI